MIYEHVLSFFILFFIFVMLGYFQSAAKSCSIYGEIQIVEGKMYKYNGTS